MMGKRLWPSAALHYSLVFFLASAAHAVESVYIKGKGVDGIIRELDVSRYPALYTRNFADCLTGGSLFNITKFDVAYYADNSTVLFHLDGSTNIRKEFLMLNLAIQAYGESRFNTTYNPCEEKVHSMCPLNASVPFTAYGVIPIAPSDVSGFSPIALGLPDFEGFARLRIFANSTQTDIGCFQAVMTNGVSLSQPKYIGICIGVLALLAVAASFVTTIYGVSIRHMRIHYAHSLSALLVFETCQSIFLSGALSVNWPSVLPAWWSNFAWSVGIISNNYLTSSISRFTGNAVGLHQVGDAGSVTINNDGNLAQQIYGRDFMVKNTIEQSFALAEGVTMTPNKRNTYNKSNPYDYSWSGSPNAPGMPIPGTWPGFSGTISVLNVPPTEAFTLALIWFAVLLVGVATMLTLSKVLLEICIKFRCIKTDGFNYFRTHILDYLAVALLRTVLIGAFAITTLALYQCTLRASAAPTAVAAVIFVLLLTGKGSIITYACYSEFRNGKFEMSKDRFRLETGLVFNKFPFISLTRERSRRQKEGRGQNRSFATVRTFGVRYTNDNPHHMTVHKDIAYIKRFGWFSARYRRTRWWYFAYYFVCQIIRACFLGGGSNTPLAQVFGLFLFEIVALVVNIKLKPYEGSRNTMVAVWMNPLSRVITTGLTIAFLPDFNLNRIATTVLGFIIIVIQGFLIIAVLILIILSSISSWMSLSRNREEFPKHLDQLRISYFEHLQKRSEDGTFLNQEVQGPLQPIESSFEVKQVRRLRKLDDEEQNDVPDDVGGRNTAAYETASGTGSEHRSRANSASSRHSISRIPRAARVHRVSWSSKEFSQMQTELLRHPEAQRSLGARGNSYKLQINPASILNTNYVTDAPPLLRRPMTPTRESQEVDDKNVNLLEEERNTIQIEGV